MFGKIECPICEGAKKIECPFCEANGVIAEDPTKPLMAGNKILCEHCGGAKYIKCNECGGTGEIESPQKKH